MHELQIGKWTYYKCRDMILEDMLILRVEILEQMKSAQCEGILIIMSELITAHLH